MASFSANITRFIEKTKLSADTVMRKVCLDAYYGLANRSPVRTGRFKGNWRAGVNQVDSTTNDDKLKSGLNPTLVATLGKVKFGDTVFLSNNLPYAGVIEHGKPGVKYADGRKAHSAQAPTGVLHNTFEDLKNKLEAAVLRVESEL